MNKIDKSIENNPETLTGMIEQSFLKRRKNKEEYNKNNATT